MSNPEFVREYEFKDGLCIRCRSNCCLFCSYCTDVYYDWHGPYAIICQKKIQDGFIIGMSGKCKSFCDRDNNEKKVLEDDEKETFWDSLSEADLMEPMHHFED